MKKSVLVIGSGFAGLSAAAFLAKEGCQVTVLEKNSGPGGRAGQFTQNGFSFDKGPSWYWMPDVFERFFNSFGKKVSDFYELTRLNPSYRVYFENDYYDIPAGRAELKVLFESIEVGSGTRLDQYLAQAEVKYKLGMQKLVYKPGLSILEFADRELLYNVLRLQVFNSMKGHVSRYFKSPILRQLMEFPVLFLGALPENTPALYSLMNYADMELGTWYPQGGMFEIVKAMVAICTAQGVVFHYNEEVTSIDVQGRSVRSVHTHTGEWKADIVVSGMDYHYTETRLLQPEYRTYSEKYWESRALAPSCLIFYLGLNKKLNGLQHHSLFFDVPFEEHARQIYSHPKWPQKPLFYMSATSVTDPTVAPAGGENLFLLIPVAAGLKNDTETLRKTYFEKLTERLEQKLQQSIIGNVMFYRSFSVSDFESEYHAFKGNAYGLANTLRQTALGKPACKSGKLNNLFYTGQFTVPGPGVPPALISGEVVAKQIIKTLNGKV